LEGVGRFLGVPERAYRDRPQPVLVAGEQQAERVIVAVDVPPEQFGIGRRFTREGRQDDPRTTTLKTSA
jgi:hypothetical protein